MNKKGDLPKDFFGWAILGVVTLLIMIGIFVVVSDKTNAAVEFLKNIFRR